MTAKTATIYVLLPTPFTCPALFLAPLFGTPFAIAPLAGADSRFFNGERQRHVFFSNPTLGVGRKHQAYMIVIDSNIRMMIGLFRHFSDSVSKGYRLPKAFKSPFFGKCVVFISPVGQ